MTFLHETDVSVAGWWLRGNDWPVRSQHGPPGFAAYVRLRRHDELLDETDVEVLTWLLDDLAAHTSTPDDVVVAQWEGNVTDPLVRWVDEEQRRVVRSEVVAHFLPREVRDGPKARRDGDAYLLFRGRLAELGDWPVRADHPEELAWDRGFPEVVCGAMWPEDRAWCYVWDTDDDDGATVACGEDLAAVLLADERYAAWRVARGEPDPPERRLPRD